MPALVHEDLSIVGEHDACAFEGPRRRSLEVDPACPEAAAVAGAFELVFRGQIVRRAAEMRADRDNRIEAADMEIDILGRPHEPDPELFLPPLVDSHAVLVRETG